MSRGRVAFGLAALAAVAGVTSWGYLPRSPCEGGGGVPSAEPRPGERVRVEVLNAGGVAGRAGEATDRLREAGFDVVDYGNAPAFDRESSSVLDRVGRMESARAVANALGMDSVVSEPDSNLYVDVTVMLGRDWTGSVTGRSGECVAPERPFWDPRHWLGR